MLKEIGHDLVECQDGPSALARLTADTSIEVLVADLAMPGMNGLELAEEVHKRRPNLPILLITGFAEKVSIPAHISLLRKPFQRDELAKRLAEVGR
jgi:CheY-like chemotaxis protein